MRICKNNITDQIRDLFDANPLRIPEARIQPMCMLEIQNHKQKYLGEFKFLVKDGFEHTIAINTAPVAQVSDVKTKKIDFKIGFDILGNFIKAFGLDPAVIGASVKGSSKMAFSFGNVVRKYIDTLELGHILVSHDIKGDQDNIFIKNITDTKDVQLALITDILTSTDFSLSTYKDNTTQAEINIPLIQDYLGNIDTGLTIEKVSENEVKFKGETPLTYAFTCVEINIDPLTGKFSRGQWLDNIRSVKGAAAVATAEQIEIPKLLLDDNQANPLLIDF
ncbi:gasdermin [Aquimarina sp. 2304DJ70-9]|uniref:gasdermin n=1 Tax=Aquimarina penaris TaxID=3231044 RepID=UPI0034627F1D